MKHELPEMIEIGAAEDTILGCSCSSCDCSSQQSGSDSGAIDFEE